MTKKKNFSAIIGSGYFAKIYIKYLVKSKLTTLKKVFYKKNKPQILIKKYPNITFTNNLNDILKDKTIKDVFIITPIESHYLLFKKFLEAGKNCLVEKPLLTTKVNISKLDKKFSLLKRTVSYPYKYSHALEFIKNYLNKNKLNNFRHIDITFFQYGKFFNHDVEKILGPHAFTILNEFINLDKLKHKKILISKNKGKNEKVRFDMYLKDKNIASINLCINYSFKKVRLFEMIFDNSSICWEINNNKSEVTISKIKREKYKNYKIGKKVFEIKKKFNENNNIEHVIEDFFSQSKSDLELSKNLLSLIQ